MLSKVTRKKRVNNILKTLREEYPDAGPMLNFSNPLELLIAGILAAQCTDEKVNEVTAHLFKRYKSAQDYAEADVDELMKEIYSTGTFRKKALRIKECCRIIANEHGGNVPADMEALSSIPGIGRKTANMVLADAFSQPGIIMDTHVIRLSGRIGLSDKKYPDKIELDLLDIVPRQDRTIFSHLLAFHGRSICVARNPKCEICKIKGFCDYYRDLKQN